MLYEHQRLLVKKNPAKHLLLWETGTGKTIAAISWANTNMKEGKTLVVCPKMLQENWKRNCAEHGNDRYTIISKEQFRKYWMELPYYTCLIIDEAHNHAGHTSQLHKATVSYIKKWNTPFVLGLTATPYSQPWNVYGLAAIVGRPMNWFSFRKTFFYEVRMGHKMIPKARNGMDGKLIELLHLFGTTQKLEDCIDMPESVYETETFTLTPEQERHIENAYDPLPVVRFTREHQITGGTLKGDEYEKPIMFDCPKMDRLEEIVRENARIIVVCRYLHEMDALKERLGTIRPVYLVSGQVKDRDSVIQALKGATSYCLIAQAQCSEGWELPECPLMVFYSMSWRFIDRVQMEGRIRRISNPKKNAYITLVVDNSADEAVYDAISRKQDFQADLYERTGLPGKADSLGTSSHP